MRRMFTVLAAAFAVVAFSSMTYAQAPVQAEKAAKPAVEKVAKPAAEKVAPAAQAEKTEKKAAKKPAATVATGKVAKYDAATKTLTVTTKKGDENFTLTADTKIMAGAKAGKEDELVAGKNVKVNYTEAAGQMTATKVTIAGEKAAKKAEKKAEEKK